MSDFATVSIDALTRTLERQRDPERAVQMGRYMRNQFPFFGIRSADVTTAMRPIIADARSASGADVTGFAQLAWRLDEREFQYAAALLLRRRVAALTAAQLDTVQALIVDKSWWDTVDSLAAHTVGPMVMGHPELVSTMDRWIDDDNMWLRRTALLHQLSYRDLTDRERLFRYCLKRADEPEFFIRKAIGWALRQYARVAPDEVRAFVLDHDDAWSGLTRREALKHLG